MKRLRKLALSILVIYKSLPLIYQTLKIILNNTIYSEEIIKEKLSNIARAKIRINEDNIINLNDRIPKYVRNKMNEMKRRLQIR